MRGQIDIQAKHRVILMEWLMEVSDKFQLKRQTYHLAVHYADRFLSKVPKY